MKGAVMSSMSRTYCITKGVSRPRLAVPKFSMKNTKSSGRAWGLASTSRKARRRSLPPRPWYSGRSRRRDTAKTITPTTSSPTATTIFEARERGSSESMSRNMAPRASRVPAWLTAVFTPKTRVRSWWSVESSAPRESCGIEKSVVPVK